MRHYLWLVVAVIALIAVNIFLRWPAPVPSFYQPLTKQANIKNFSDCVAAGFPVIESYPRQCRTNDTTYVEEVSNQPEPNKDPVTLCEPAQRGQDFCAQIYEPVCAKVNIQCITTPCNPIEQTFGNSCEACQNGLVESYKLGACAEK